jgi:hypothetical protein
MTDRSYPLRRWGRAALMASLFLLVSGALLLWAWNAVAIELFDAPAIRFKHALAFQAAFAALATMPLLIARYLRRTDPGNGR